VHIACEVAALFSPRATTIARGVIIGGLTLLVFIPAVAMGWVRTPWARGEHHAVAQPIAFDHRIHVTGLRIDCRYCHADAERTASAGLPSTKQCVACHSRTWMSTSVMAPVRRSLETGRPITWARVTQLPDFVYFDHAIHVDRGVGCETCHGRVDRMATAEQAAPLTMGWCLDCHRNPGSRLRPLADITTMGWRRASSDTSGARLAAQGDRIRRLTDCTTCHR
jgi:hypothetical protein